MDKQLPLYCRIPRAGCWPRTVRSRTAAALPWCVSFQSIGEFICLPGSSEALAACSCALPTETFLPNPVPRLHPEVFLLPSFLSLVCWNG